MNKKQLFRHSLFLLFLLSLAACGTSDTVTVVQDRPQTITPGDTADVDTDEEFQEISIGITDSVENFDPLFADNLSTKRVLSLIYDGLFTLDRSGEVIPAIADEVSVSDDGREYRIKIKSNLFFHDGPAFQSGIGRRLQASDIKWAFERAARAGVPTTASELLMNIEGYSSFAKEQRQLFESRKRVLEEVSGIVVEDSRTIVFLLAEPDEDFLKKLASPYLFIYPREAIQSGDNSLSNRPLGTGAYIFRDKTDDGKITLAKDDSERAANRLDQPRVNRIDFIIGSKERTLFQKFARGDIHWIPEIGPEISLQLTDGEGNLGTTYRDIYRITQSSAERSLYFYFNKSDRVNLPWLKNRLYEADFSSIGLHATLKKNEHEDGFENNQDPDSTYLVAYTEDIFARNFIVRLQREFIEPDASLNLFELRVPTNRTAMYVKMGDSFHDRLIQRDADFWTKMSIPVTGLYLPTVYGVAENNVPWKLFMESIRVPEQD